MGLYDRDYYQEEPRGYTIRRPRTIVTTLILVNVGLWLANVFITRGNELTDLLAVRGDTIVHPLLWWKFLTYGFAHSPSNLWHIVGNMLGLFFLAPRLEQDLGSKEFLRLYLAMIVFGGVIWGLFAFADGQLVTTCVGASGAVVGVVVLFALRYPRSILMLYGIIPIPAWLLGALVVIPDLLSATGVSSHGFVAYQVHLAGALLAFCYHRFRWNFTRLTDGWSQGVSARRRPKLRVHNPGPEPEDDNLGEDVDKILKKWHEQGEASLTRKERKILENASRQARRKRGSDGY